MPIGAAPTAETPSAIEGGRPLIAITTSVRDAPDAAWRISRRVALEYALRSSVLHYPIPAPDPPPADTFCTHVPLRYLTKIRATAYDPQSHTTSLPPVTFTYNDRLDATLPTDPPPWPHPIPPTVPSPGFGHYGTEQGAVGTLLDLDSDGIRDRLSVTEENATCTLVWQKGIRGGRFEDEIHRMPLPTAPWSNDPDMLPPEYGHFARLPDERCTLNGQTTYRYYRSPSNITGYTRGVLSYHFMDYTGDGHIDLVTNVWAATRHDTFAPRSYPIAGGALLPPAQVPQRDNPPPPPPDPQLPTPMTPERDNMGHYIWRVFSNVPTCCQTPPLIEIGVVTPDKVNDDCAPEPLPPSANDSLLDPSTLPNVSIPSLTDLDGDGFLDLVDVGKNVNVLRLDGDWCVWFGRGGTEFSPVSHWRVPQGWLSLGGPGYDEVIIEASGKRYIKRTTVAALLDINGDGRSDLVVQNMDQRLIAFLNTGTGFWLEPIDLAAFSPVEITQTDYSYDSRLNVQNGARGYLLQLVDVDGDRLPDLLSTPGVGNDITQVGTPHVRFNTGDHFTHRVALPDRWADAKRLYRFKDGAWQVETDFFDANGDGLSDLVRWSPNGRSLDINASPGLPAAPDLLSGVDNGHGLRISFSYGLSTDLPIVQQLYYFLPYPIWVVRAVTVSGGFGTPDMVTRYNYQYPAYYPPRDYVIDGSIHSNYPEASHFMGFGQATAEVDGTGGTLARWIVRSYIALSVGGRVAHELVYRRQGAAWLLHKYTENTWERKDLFDGQTFFLPRTSSLTRICLPGATAAACVAQTDNVYRSQATWTPFTPSNVGQVALYVRDISQEGSGVQPGALDRRTHYTHQVRYGQAPFAPDDYRVLVTETTFKQARQQGNALAFEPSGRARTTYDAKGLPIASEQWLDANTVATTRRTFDSKTGNLLSVTRPQQAAAGGSGKRTTYTYDAHALFVQTTVNELGHQVFTTHDLATGALLERAGPNFVTMPWGERSWERETWRIDGVGRVVVHAISFDKADGYTLQTVQKTTYFDSQLPYRVRDEQLRDFGGNVWITSDKTLDGLGRPLTVSQLLDGNRAAVTTFTYDGSGNIAAIETPDPRSDDGTRVRYTYSYDGLGRLISLTRPDNSGVSIGYAGLEKAIREVVPGGSGSTKKQVYDAFGRLIEVHENTAVAQPSVTRYRYDAHDNLSAITDAEGNVTTLAHDWLSNRVAIARGERTWRYAYDLNGNLVAETAPVPPGALPQPYRTTYAYDDLDRVTLTTFADQQIQTLAGSTPAPAPGNPGQAAPYKVYLPIAANPFTAAIASAMSTIRYNYDTGRNGLGRLSRVTLPFGEVHYAYDARGLVTAEQRSFAIHDIANISVSQRVQRAYNALGQLTQSTWDDGQQWRMGYDVRGMVATVEWYDPAARTWRQVASYERSLAGLPRTRNSAYGQVRQYTYDQLGRVVQDAVSASGRSSPIATRAYSFTGSGDLASISGATNGVSAAASYTYDTQHRLTGATGPNGYAGSFTYSATGNMLTAKVRWNGSGESRNVRSEYGTRDPQAVDRLVDVGSGRSYAEFSYDLAGNMVRRATPEGDMSLQWNGLGQLRAVQTANGREAYFYDHTGARLLAVSAKDGVRFWFGESETHYTLAGVQTRRYLHLSDGGSALARVENGTKIELQYADALQNLMLALDAQGNVVANLVYGPFGEVIQAAGEQDHRRQFNGKENDALSGLRYYGYRYYDPMALRWNSADPLYRFVPDLGLAAPQRMNLYAFSLNNPVRYYDPDGREPLHGSDTITIDSSPDGGDMNPWDPWGTGTLCDPGLPGSCKEGGSLNEEGDSSTSGDDTNDDQDVIEMEPLCLPSCERMKANLTFLLKAANDLKESYDESAAAIAEHLRNGRAPTTWELISGVFEAAGSVASTAVSCSTVALCAAGAAAGGVGLSDGLDRAFSNKPYEEGNEVGDALREIRSNAQYRSRRLSEQILDIQLQLRELDPTLRFP